MMKNQKGFAVLELMVGLSLIGVIFIACCFIYQKSNKTSSGTHKDTDLELIDKTYCSDVCPQQTRSFRVYKNINSQDDCNKVGGQTIKDAAWGGFLGCGPRPNDAPAVIKG